MTTFKGVQDRAVGNLNADVDNSTGTWVLQGGQGASFPDPTVANYWVTCENEQVLVTGLTTDTLTVTRAQNGTSGAAHSAADAVELRVVAQQVKDIHTAIVTLEGQVGNVDTHLVHDFPGMAIVVIDGTALLTTVGLTGRFRLSHRLTFTKLSYIVGNPGSANAILSIGIFSQDGQTQYMDEDDAVADGNGPQTFTFSAVTLPPGDYYVMVTLSSGTTGPQLKMWDDAAQDLITTNSPASEPVYEGTYVVTAGAIPATFDPDADLTAAVEKTLFLRMDGS